MAQKNLFIAISFHLFIAILRAKMSRVNKALGACQFLVTAPASSKNDQK